MTGTERYEAQVLHMSRQVRDWLEEHPYARVQLQRPVAASQLESSLAASLDCGLCSASEDARQMFADLDWLHDDPEIAPPTALMAEKAMELVMEAAR
jgi:hypothetical protein